MGNISILEKVENAIDEIRPYLIADGGDIKVVSVDNKNIVNLELLGSCEKCPISDMTLKNGVEETLNLEIFKIVNILG